MTLASPYYPKSPIHLLVLKSNVTLVQTLRLIILAFLYLEFLPECSALVFLCNKVSLKVRYHAVYTYKTIAQFIFYSIICKKDKMFKTNW